MIAQARRRVPPATAIALAAALAAQLAWRLAEPAAPSAEGMAAAPSPAVLRLASLGEQQAMARLVMLHTQALDDQPGANTPLRQVDYAALAGRLGAALDLDPRSQYPLLAASRVYAAVDDPARIRTMLGFVASRFGEDPARRWPWLLEAQLAARYRLQDPAQASGYAAQLAAAGAQVPAWARQLAHDQPQPGELAATRAVAGALLQHGMVRDANEARALDSRLQALEPVRPDPGRRVR